MREPEQRVTALLNDEIQIGQFMPPHMRQRVEKSTNLRITPVDSVEIMFLAMQPKPPFDKKEVRQAVCHAINRDQIIGTFWKDSPAGSTVRSGPGQYGYDPNLKPKLNYDPETAKKLLAQAGYPNGVDVELQTPVGRYTLDKQLTEAMIPMLNAVGIRAKLLTPEWATLWANVQKGTMPFYYMGRGSVQDPSAALHQYFHTGETPRIGYSNPKLDELLDKEQAEFDPEKATTISVAGDEHHHRRRARLLHVAPQAALGTEQPRRLQTVAGCAYMRSTWTVKSPTGNLVSDGMSQQ